jgi:hypothetical protein
MGCDIHAYVEVSYVDKPRVGWNQLCEYRFGRNYLLFALMAGVRRYSSFPSAETLERELTKRGVETLDDPRLSAEEVELIVTDAADSGITNGVPSFEAKGCPKDLSYHTEGEWSHFVVDDDTSCEPGYVKRSKALEQVANGWAEVWQERDGEVLRITNSDWHTPSWLDTAEIGELAKRLEKSLEGYVEEARRNQQSGIRWAEAALKSAIEDGDADEIEKLQKELDREKMWSTHDPLNSETFTKVKALHALMSALEAPGLIRARLVFWFDN